MERFGQLVFVSDAGVNKHGKKLWNLRCDCGVETVAIASSVRNGRTASCGCGKRKGNRKTHGMRRSRLYSIWCNMKARCDNVANPGYQNYGGRGITYASRWSTFAPFASDVGEPPSQEHTLDRVDNDGMYEPGNVRWAIRAVQSRNTRQNVWVDIHGEIKCLYDWCDVYGINAASVYRRMAAGEGVVSAITRPKAPRFRR